MSFTFGFYNAVDHDRRYDAIQMSSLFDGIICDGVLSSYGDGMKVTPGNGMQVIVNPGRAWFNHTWNLIDAQLPVEIPIAEVVLSRIDAVVLEVNSNVDVRSNSIKIVSGIPDQRPERPTLEHSEYVNQYALAYVTVGPSVTEIKAADIKQVIGTSETPLSTGLIQQITMDNLLSNWSTQYDQMMTADEAEFREWFANLRYDLDEDAAIHLENRIYEVQQSITNLKRFETQVETYELDNTYFKNGYKSVWSISSVTETSFPNYIVDPEVYDGDIVCVTGNGTFTVYFENSPSTNMPITLIWQETVEVEP